MLQEGFFPVHSRSYRICENAFCRCANITALTIPEGVKRIERYGLCFDQGDITQIDLPASVEYIHEEGIIGTFINRITVAEGNKRYKTWNNILFTINIDTVVYCPPAMKYYDTLPESVTHIGNCAFRVAIADVILTNVKTIGTFAFWGNCLAYHTDNRHFILPETVEKIDDYAFCYSCQMWEVTIPSSVKEIGKNVFEYSSRGEYTTNSRKCFPWLQ